MSNPYAWLGQSLETIHRADWYRSVRTIQGSPGAIVVLDGQEVINFASNDYLGPAGDRHLIYAATIAIQEFGTGSTGSRCLADIGNYTKNGRRQSPTLNKQKNAWYLVLVIWQIWVQLLPW